MLIASGAGAQHDILDIRALRGIKSADGFPSALGIPNRGYKKGEIVVRQPQPFFFWNSFM
jgi:hypothetical protein